MNLYFRLLLFMIRVRFRSRLSMWDTSHVRFRVNLSDLDVMRHMNNGRYLTLMDLGRMDLMVRSGFWQHITDQGWYPVVAGQTITYRKSLQLREKVDLASRVLGHDDRWIYMEQVFRRDGKVVADAIVRARFLRRSGGSVPMEEVLELVKPLPENLEVPEWVTEWNEGSSRHGREL
ncbi:MAG: acyl-CoA thioesterase [Brachybacterium sp.]|uniref:acyl-CoA thioesterase n=1 Tax=Brachybacterium sp. TaxID=1891286 RepID=UPI0026536CD9|nr:thioesterase family protein [Brachybacterium sp.]MDN6302176.1 thioesterase family protein [Brachybacterium sp.]MDN6329290.1 thioesterase family protein [Brachybacterium sp.]MDN6400451.1 thioesterase family protein [Brachybacterium sp.]